MAKYRVVRETQADGAEWYYPERKILGVLWWRYYVCWMEWVHRFTTEEGAWDHIETQERKKVEEDAKYNKTKVIKREVV